MLPSDWWRAPRPGDYVISAEYLVRGLDLADTEGAASDWLRRYRPAGVLGGTLYLYRFPQAPQGDVDASDDRNDQDRER